MISNCILTLFGKTGSAATKEETCAICLHALDMKNEIHETSCGHKFHSKCFIQHLLTEDIRCPLCRKYPNPDDYRNGVVARDADDEEETNEEAPRISRSEAWQNARKSSDKRVKQFLVTIHKWKNEARKARDALMQITEVLQRQEDLIEGKVSAFHQKLTADYR